MSAPPIVRCSACGETRPLLSITSAAELADVNRKTIYRWIHAGLLEFRRLPSGTVRIFEESLLRVPRGSRKRHGRTKAPSGNGGGRPPLSH